MASDADSGPPEDPGAGQSGEPEASATDFDRAFGLLANHRRRHVLERLRGTASVEDLVEHLVAEDPGTDDGARALVALQHRELPRLHDAGVVDFDRRTNTVSYRGDELVEAILDFAAGGNE